MSIGSASNALEGQMANLEAPSLSQPTNTPKPTPSQSTGAPMGIVSNMSAREITGATASKPVTKDWKGVVVPGNIYELGNTDGISVGASPGINKILDFVKAGKAKLVDAYPYTYVKNGYLATGYSDQPTTPNYYNRDADTYEQPEPQKLLLMDGKLYAGGNDWGISPVTESVQTGASLNGDGQLEATYSQVPTGAYRIRTRADNNVFDEAVIKPDAAGNIVAYSPKPWQTGSNSGGFFGSSFLGNIANDLVSMAKETAPVWMPAVSAGLPSILPPSVSSAISNVTQAANLVNAVESGNVLGALSSGAGLAGLGGTTLGDTGLTISDALKAAKLAAAVESGNLPGAVSGLASLVQSPTVQDTASKLLDQVTAPTTEPSGIAAITPETAVPPSGIQVAGPVPEDAFRTDVGGVPTYAESANAGQVAPPFGYNLLPMSMADNKPQGSYYDPTQNAWFMPNTAVQDLQQQLMTPQEQVPVDDGTTAGIQDLIKQTTIPTTPSDIINVSDLFGPTTPATTPEAPVTTPETPVTTPEQPAPTPETPTAAAPETPAPTPEQPAVVPQQPTGIETLPPAPSDYLAADQTQTQTNLQDPFAYTPPTTDTTGIAVLPTEPVQPTTSPTGATMDDFDYLSADAAQNTANDYYAANQGTGLDYLGADAEQELINQINNMGDVGMGADAGSTGFLGNMEETAATEGAGVAGTGLPTGAGGATGIGASASQLLNALSKFTGLTPNMLKLLGAGLGGLGIGSLLGGQQQKAPTPTPYTGPLSQIQYSPSTYTPYTYKPYAAGGPVEGMSYANAIGANTGFPMANIQKGAYATPFQQPISQNVVTGPEYSRVDPYTGEEKLAGGGIASLGAYSDGGRMLRGPGDGVSDSIPAVIGDGQPARLADGEFVIPARIVSELGNGSTEAGARQLYAMMDRIQAARRKSVGKGKVAVDSKAAKHLPA